MKKFLYLLVGLSIFCSAYSRPVTFEWDPNQDVISHYRIWKIINGSRNLIGSTPVGINQLTIDGINNNDEIGITAFRDTDGMESEMSSTIFVPYVAPYPPTGLFVSLTSSTYMTFKWNKNTENDMSYYILYWGKASNSYTSFITTTNLSYVVRKFPIGYYYASIVAVNTSGQKSLFAPEMEFKVGKRTVFIAVY